MSDENDITLPPEYMERDFQRVQQEAQTRQRLLNVLFWATLKFDQDFQRIQQEAKTRQRLLKILFWAALSFVMILAFSF